MFGLSAPHLILLGIVVLLLFGGKSKISDLMGDVAKGIKSFKKGMADDDSEAKPATPPAPPRPLENRASIDATETHKVN